MALAWVPVYDTPELNCSLVKDFIPLCRILSTGSQCTIPFSTSLNGLCWVLIHFCSIGCKYLGKLLHFFQYLQSFPSKWAIMKPLKSIFAVQQRREEDFQVLASTRHPAPIFHCESVSTYFSQWNVSEAKGWETPLVTVLNALCLEKRLTCSLVASPGSWHQKKSTNDRKAQLLFAAGFYFHLHFMQSAVASASPLLNLVFNRKNPSSHGLWGGLKALPSPWGLVGSLPELGNGSVFQERAIKCRAQ